MMSFQSHNAKILAAELLKLSHAASWMFAKKEWFLDYIQMSDEDRTCLCSHNPIREICIIRNSITGKKAEIGNVCVKKFIDHIDTSSIFACVKNISGNPRKSSANLQTIEYFYRRRFITKWEFDFLIDTMKRRSLSEKQLNVREKLNNRIVAASRLGLAAGFWKEHV